MNEEKKQKGTNPDAVKEQKALDSMKKVNLLPY